MRLGKQDKKKQASTQPVESKTVAQKSNKKKLIIIAAAVLILGVAAYFIFTQILGQRGSVAIPSGWKQYTTNTFGVSFVMPKDWQVKELDPQTLNSGANAYTGSSITAYNPKDYTGSFSIGVFKGTLDATIKQQIANNGLEKSGYKSATESLKWHGYDAKKLTLTTTGSGNGSEAKESVYTMIYAQVSDYVFLLPDKYETSASLKNSKITKQEYTQFTDSIRIDRAAVEAQAKLASKPADLPKAKDINLGEVTVPSGWKKFESSVNGISFVIPNAWEVKEQVNPSEGAALGLTIGSSSSFTDSAIIVVVKTKLDEFLSQSGYAGAAGSNGAVSSKVEKLKWQGKEARRVKLSSSNDKNAASQTALFVGIGDYTYVIPDPTANLSGVASGKFDAKEYKTFAESVRIKES